ncbi:antitoxin [Frigoribacterium sp. Leaf186]|uniref:antitoxin n=1 Tax=Frigoribacterium sp. Leaf186 TaxID=1736293 RepID=UPI0009EC15BF|nr:antitoxin [Frigoribacterium sp. Leaf186]
MGLMDSAKDALNSDKGEKLSDAGIEKAEQAASSKTGGKFDEKIEKAGETADGKVGDGH